MTDHPYNQDICEDCEIRTICQAHNPEGDWNPYKNGGCEGVGGSNGKCHTGGRG